MNHVCAASTELDQVWIGSGQWCGCWNSEKYEKGIFTPKIVHSGSANTDVLLSKQPEVSASIGYLMIGLFKLVSPS